MSLTYLRKNIYIKPIEWEDRKSFGTERYYAKLPFRCWASIHKKSDSKTWRWVLKQGTITMSEGEGLRQDHAMELVTECWNNLVMEALVIEYITIDDVLSTNKKGETK